MSMMPRSPLRRRAAPSNMNQMSSSPVSGLPMGSLSMGSRPTNPVSMPMSNQPSSSMSTMNSRIRKKRLGAPSFGMM